MHKLIEAIYDLTGEENRKGDNDPNQRVEAIFNKLDLNQNGTIGRKSFLSLHFFNSIFPSSLIRQKNLKSINKGPYLPVLIFDEKNNVYIYA